MRHSCCCWWKRSWWLSKMRYFYSRFQWMTIYLVASNRCVFPQQQNFALGSLAQISSGAIRCSFYTRFRRGSGSFWCRYPVRFRKIPVQIPGGVPEGSGQDAWWGSGGFWWWWLVRFRRVLARPQCEKDAEAFKLLGIAPEVILATDPLCLTVMILESQSDLCSPMNPLQSPLLAFRWLAQHLWPPRAQMVINFWKSMNLW